MSWNTDPRTTFIVEQGRSSGLQSAIAQAQAEEAASKARLAAEQAQAAARAAQNGGGGSALDRQTILNLRREVESQKDEVLDAKRALAAANQALQEKEEMILDWMHSNEAFKKLVGQYGKKLGLTEEQIKADRKEAVLDVAEEDPRYQSTKLSQKARQP